jgi:glycosyltransferase involved in cell wall biosynthesis
MDSFTTRQRGAEARLIATADLVIASSDRLYEFVQSRAKQALLVRNGCDYEHFVSPFHQLLPRRTGPIIGYYGAIADWFDSMLVADLASARPEWKFELIGSTLGGDVRRLDELANVRLLGECPYPDLPRMIRQWDVYMIPFKRIPLTEATNPVKVYEMLATGKPVVAVPLPELETMASLGLVRLASDSDGFAAAIAAALAENSPRLAERRREFARDNTWEARGKVLREAIEKVLPSRGADTAFGNVQAENGRSLGS